jgi:APA family basic amino acid/polyamine antiporter
MAEDNLFFKAAKKLNKARVPGVALILQAAWTTLLVLARTYDSATGKFGNLYGQPAGLRGLCRADFLYP